MLTTLTKFIKAAMIDKTQFPSPEQAIPGRDTAMTVDNQHFVTGHPIQPPFPKHLQCGLFGMGCFWGAERRFWLHEGVFSTAVGYSGGITPNPNYEEVCTGMTGHNEVVLVIFNPEQCSYQSLLELFWESHNPTQGMRQGNDTGTQYRSGIYYFDLEQQHAAESSRDSYQRQLLQSGLNPITTEIKAAEPFYYAEIYHQQYLAKNPNGYCSLGGTGIGYIQCDR